MGATDPVGEETPQRGLVSAFPLSMAPKQISTGIPQVTCESLFLQQGYFTLKIIK